MSAEVTVLEYDLIFSKPARTSRGVMQVRKVWYLFFSTAQEPYITGIGECAPLEGLSQESVVGVRNILLRLSNGEIPFVADADELIDFPSIRFAVETAILDYRNGGRRILFSEFDAHHSCSIPINGLVWMNNSDTMLKEALQKIGNGFKCIKLKIGGLPFEDELFVLRQLRKTFGPEDVEIRLDANGAFLPSVALDRLKILSEFFIHSVEQPIPCRQWNAMADLCSKSPIPLALDEELIGVNRVEEKKALLEFIQPAFIILKPSLHGGLAGLNEWIKCAGSLNIKWWATSALESNIGLNAIAQWISRFENLIPQGLGTGELFTNNIVSPWEMRNGMLVHNKSGKWDLSSITNKN